MESGAGAMSALEELSETKPCLIDRRWSSTPCMESSTGRCFPSDANINVVDARQRRSESAHTYPAEGARLFTGKVDLGRHCADLAVTASLADQWLD